jgi:hypothetical protein
MDARNQRILDFVEDPEIVWGAEAIGRVINQTPRQTHHLLKKGFIKAARQCGGRWFADKAGLRAQFCVKVEASGLSAS